VYELLKFDKFRRDKE